MKKIICLLLALLLVFPLIASCGGGDDSGETAKTTKKANVTKATSGGDETQPTESADAYVFPNVNMNGDEIFIMERWFGYGKPTIDFTGEVINPPDDEYTATSVNVAKTEVIKEVQNKLNCKITGEIYTGDNIVATLREKVIKDVQSGTAEYDILFESYYYYSPYIKSGFLYDLNKLEGFINDMKLTTPWQTFGQLIVEHLALPQAEMPFYNGKSRRKAEKLYRRIMEEGNFNRQSSFKQHRPKHNKLLRKAHAFLGIFIDAFHLATIFPDVAFREMRTELKLGFGKMHTHNKAH